VSARDLVQGSKQAIQTHFLTAFLMLCKLIQIMSFITFPRALVLLLFVAMALPGFAESPSLSSLGKPQKLTSPDQVPEGLQKSDWASVRAAHMAWQHRFQPLEDGWQARNPEQQWTMRFDGRGFLATPHDGDWTWGLELESYGRGDQQRKVNNQPAVKAEGQKLSYQWDATVQEWWVNDQRGLEHGYTLAQRPAAICSGGAAPRSAAGTRRGT
jgi:hypothetical protein